MEPTLDAAAFWLTWVATAGEWQVSTLGGVGKRNQVVFWDNSVSVWRVHRKPCFPQSCIWIVEAALFAVQSLSFLGSLLLLLSLKHQLLCTLPSALQLPFPRFPMGDLSAHIRVVVCMYVHFLSHLQAWSFNRIKQKPSTCVCFFMG